MTQTHDHRSGSSTRITSLTDLNSELLGLIFEQLRDESPLEGLHAAQRLSRRLYEIATPIAYRSVELNEYIVSPRAEQHHPAALGHIYVHTRHVIVRSDLDPLGVRRLLHKVRRLQTVRWRYVDNGELHAQGLWLPADLLPRQEPLLQLHVENPPLGTISSRNQGVLSQAIPADLLVSLRLANAPLPASALQALKLLLIQARRLESLSYQDRGQGTQFAFDADDGRLPPLRHLSLRSYDWAHNAAAAARHWDLSRLAVLDLVSVPAANFLASIDPRDLSHLRRLRVDDFSAHLPRDQRPDATRALAALVARHSAPLVSLYITCHVRLFGGGGGGGDADVADVLLPRHARSLRSLRLRDHVGFGDEERPCPTLRVRDVRRLAAGLRALHTLELDMDAAYMDRVDWADDRGTEQHQTCQYFLRALCEFPTLDTLTLHVQTALRPQQHMAVAQHLHGPRQADHDMSGRDATGGGAIADPDRERASDMFRLLLEGRQAVLCPSPCPPTAPYVPGSSPPPSSGGRVPWRSITVNVGGWRPVAVRRLGDEWRALNRRGVFAERCFVLERGAEDSRLSMREKRGAEIRL